VTGIGSVTCCGVGADALWEGLVHPDRIDTTEVRDFDPSVWFGPKDARRIDRFAQFSVAAADEALADAGDVGADPERSGVIFATGVAASAPSSAKSGSSTTRAHGGCRRSSSR